MIANETELIRNIYSLRESNIIQFILHDLIDMIDKSKNSI